MTMMRMTMMMRMTYDDHTDNDDGQVPADGEEQETKRGKGEGARLSQLNKVASYQTG